MNKYAKGWKHYKYCATLKTDPVIIKIIKRKVMKPIGFYFRKKNFDKYYK